MLPFPRGGARLLFIDSRSSQFSSLAYFWDTIHMHTPTKRQCASSGLGRYCTLLTLIPHKEPLVSGAYYKAGMQEAPRTALSTGLGMRGYCCCSGVDTWGTQARPPPSDCRGQQNGQASRGLPLCTVRQLKHGSFRHMNSPWVPTQIEDVTGDTSRLGRYPWPHGTFPKMLLVTRQSPLERERDVH